MALGSRRFAFHPDLQLRITAESRRVLRHFEAEYEPATTAESVGPPQAIVSFLKRFQGADRLLVTRGGYKTARWTVGLSHPESEPLSASIALSALPISFGVSLVQGYFVEPVLSVAAARSGFVLLPSAGVSDDGRAVLLMGRSHTGKSSLAARALVAGRRVLGDDQVLLDASGRCWPFPRRLRLYADLPHTVPQAYDRLGASARAVLRGRELLRRASRGWISPPVRVAPNELGPEAAAEPLDVAGIVLIERRAGARELNIDAVDGASAVGHALDLLERQRARLSSASSAWAKALESIREQERSMLERALEGKPVQAVWVPDDWDAARAIGALASLLQLDR
jgi:hypothetical protein